jgi:hypothetical protein
MIPAVDRLFAIGMLLVIALGATVVALTLQHLFGRTIEGIALGPVLAVLGAAVFAGHLLQK